MNKKQLIIVWMAAAFYCLTILYFMIKRWILFYETGWYGKSLSELLIGVYRVITLYFIPIFIIGVLLIYTLRDKNKKNPTP